MLALQPFSVAIDNTLHLERRKIAMYTALTGRQERAAALLKSRSFGSERAPIFCTHTFSR